MEVWSGLQLTNLFRLICIQLNNNDYIHSDLRFLICILCNKIIAFMATSFSKLQIILACRIVYNIIIIIIKKTVATF